MAKKKPDERSPRNKERRDIADVRTIGFRVSHGYADWLERAAKHNRVTVSTFIDIAATNHAKATGFDEPPPERIP